MIYRDEDGGQNWAPQIVATTGSHKLVVTDLDADGDLDLLGANHASPPLEIGFNESNPQACSPFTLLGRISEAAIG